MAERALEVTLPNLGAYLDRAAIAVPKRGLSSARNVRVRNGRILRHQMGWAPFFDVDLNGPVLGIHRLVTRDGSQTLIFGTPTDLYRFDQGLGEVRFVTPRYDTGTAIVQNSVALVLGVGTAWVQEGVKPGDQFHSGAAGQTDPDAVWWTVLSVGGEGTLTLTAPFVGASGTFPYTIRRLFAGSGGHPWIAAVYFNTPPLGQDKWYATNGVDVPVSWDGNATQVTRLTALNFTCRWLTSFKNMMIYGDLTEGGERQSNSIRNSAIGEPENVSTLEAGQVNGTDGPDILLQGLPLGDFLIAYGRTTESLLQFVGPPLFWVVRTISRLRGPLSARAVIDRGDYHEFASRDGVYRFDGVRLLEVGRQVFQEALRTLDPNRLPQAFAFLAHEEGEVLWAIPSTTDGPSATAFPRTGHAEHFLEPVGEREAVPVIPRDLPNASAMGEFDRSVTLRFNDLVDEFRAYDFQWNDRFFEAGFPLKLVGTASGQVFILGASDAQDGLPLAAHARSPRFAIGDGNRQGIVLRVEPYTGQRPSSTYPLKVRVYTADRPDAPSALAAELDYDLTHAGARWLRPRVRARFAEVEFATEGADQGWAILGYRVTVSEAGER